MSQLLPRRMKGQSALHNRNPATNGKPQGAGRFWEAETKMATLPSTVWSCFLLQFPRDTGPPKTHPSPIRQKAIPPLPAPVQELRRGWEESRKQPKLGLVPKEKLVQDSSEGASTNLCPYCSNQSLSSQFRPNLFNPVQLPLPMFQHLNKELPPCHRI